MKALVYHGAEERAWETVPDPSVEQPTDAIVRIDAVTICGTDLHILKGDVPEVQPGTILGHEAVGTVVETGREVRTMRTATACSSPASLPAGAAASAVRAGPASVREAVAGSSAT
jgi:threonine dehydrogenase-like Zn-dependent dehydrogenase